VPFGQSTNGSVRGQGIDRSTDGGQTWTFTALPGCLQNCGPLSVSFVDATHGFAATSPLTGDSTLFATQDGGGTWTAVASLPNLGSVSVGGPIAQLQLLFMSSLDGWGVTGPSGYGSQGQPTDAGGVLYRTTDGGATWEIAPGLPSGLQYSLPTFFGGQQAVVLATRGANDPRGAMVFATDDGGSTWTRHPLPVIRGDTFTPGSLLSRFAAVGPFAWRIDVGSLIYETSDAGRTWATVKPIPKTSLGDATSVVFSSPDVGMAIAQLPSCFASSSSDPAADVCYPVLIVTSDGGRSWSPASLPHEAR
jgi:xyloglucan-specific exo-beta-1,4-glucanase